MECSGRLFELNPSKLPKIYDSISQKLINSVDHSVLTWNQREKEEL